MALKRSLTLLRGREKPGLTMSLVNTNSLSWFSTADSGDLPVASSYEAMLKKALLEKFVQRMASCMQL